MTVASKFLRERYLARLPEVGTAHTQYAHFYTYKGNTYPSVSAPLSFWKKAELADWALKLQEEYVINNWKDFNPVSIHRHIGEMKNQANSIRDAAAKVGTYVHEARERSIDIYFKHGVWPSKWNDIYPADTPLNPFIVNGIKEWLNFVTEQEYEPVLCEARLVDPILGVAGSLDDVGFIKGKLVLIDVKTSNNIEHYTYWLQISKYWQMFRRHTKVKTLPPYLLHLPKTPGKKYSLTEIKNPKQYSKEFDQLFRLWKSQDTYKPKKKESIKI